MTKFGLIAAGPAFLIAYIIHFVLLNILTHTLQGFRWRPLSLLLLARFSPQAAVISSFCLPLATGVFGLRVVLIKMGFEGRIPARFARIYAAIGWPIRSIS
jgi:PST family polysaccharide transporter|tara:strand:+ start:229 stop:531 length:303 start_codon:yes stop_codon:yes gene_type:complete